MTDTISVRDTLAMSSLVKAEQHASAVSEKFEQDEEVGEEQTFEPTKKSNNRTAEEQTFGMHSGKGNEDSLDNDGSVISDNSECLKDKD